MAACGTKKTFITTWDAERSLKTIRAKGCRDDGPMPIRWYQCPTCSFYHLTHFEAGESNYEKARAMVGAQMAQVAARAEEQRIVATIRSEEPDRKLDRLTDSPRGGRTYKMTPEVRAKISASLKGVPKGSYKHTAAYYLKRGLPVPEEVLPPTPGSGHHKRSAETIERLRRQAQAMKGQPRSEEFKRKISEAQKGRKRTPEERAHRAVALAATAEAKIAEGVQRALKALPQEPIAKGADDKTTIARLFLERLLVMTTEERKVLLGVISQGVELPEEP